MFRARHRVHFSMQGRDAQSFFDLFTGYDRYIADYLIEEALNRQPDAVLNFLLRTSILEKLSMPFCAALMDKSSPLELADLERANLFLIPLDNTSAGFRYHHLFAELLRQRLYRAASEWSEANDDIHAAIRYARRL